MSQYFSSQRSLALPLDGHSQSQLRRQAEVLLSSMITASLLKAGGWSQLSLPSLPLAVALVWQD